MPTGRPIPSSSGRDFRYPNLGLMHLQLEELSYESIVTTGDLRISATMPSARIADTIA